ncbi:uncharacterized protein LOC121428592 isoform X1 [Lytechinus variegatus]|uniref:uncharacterized protein LOC121428592 isoform X1 n=1 Tax=Lytechinus variegatus TaxID=7654 RepID=UPI001BB2C3DE|nr:uncharacterized protein LOC121428592 isoform X1 [Lytechinus variegatus]
MWSSKVSYYLAAVVVPKAKWLFSLPMADIFGVSVRTVERRLRAYHINLREYAEISEEALDDEVRRVVGDNPLLGPNAVCARLDGIVVHIQRRRVRESMLRTYPQYAAVRALNPRLQRRTYRVAAPNSLWHVDGNHKLIRYRYRSKVFVLKFIQLARPNSPAPLMKMK